MRDQPSTLDMVVVSLGLAIMALGLIARKRPDIAWLRPFDFSAHIPEWQKKRMHRTSIVNIGAQLLVLGLAIPLGFIALKAMTFSDITSGQIVITAAAALLCIILGSYAIISGLRA